MATCLQPRFIRIDRRNSVSALFVADGKYKRYRDVRPSLNDMVQVPCGKCINCLKNRQSAMVSRCMAESEKRGTMAFVTLTYSEEYLPIAQSLWRVDKSTGDIHLVPDTTEIVCNSRDGLFVDRARVQALFANEHPRYVDTFIDGFEDDESSYFYRLTPSVCREDVRYWLKSARVAYEREFGCKLNDFSYVAVSEYGPRTCRPHNQIYPLSYTYQYNEKQEQNH